MILENLGYRSRAYPVLALVCLAFYLPGFFVLPPVDRDEPRYAQASRQMLESGDYVRIQFQDTPRFKKPIGIYWLQSTIANALGDLEQQAIWHYRIPSLLAAIASVWVTYEIALLWFSPQWALGTGLLMAVTLLLSIVAHAATTDAVLLLCALLAQWSLFSAAQRQTGNTWGWAILFWVAQGFGILLKGPMVPLVSGTTVLAGRLAFKRKELGRGLHWVWGILLALIIVVPWVWMITHISQGQFLKESVGKDLLMKLISGQESHGAPPGYYFLLSPVTFFPHSLWMVPVLVGLFQMRKTTPSAYLLSWLIPTWLLLELIPTKLPHYVMPIYPALCLGLPAVWGRSFQLGERARKWAGRFDVLVKFLFLLVGALLGIIGIVFPAYFERRFDLVGTLAFLAMVVWWSQLVKHYPWSELFPWQTSKLAEGKASSKPFTRLIAINLIYLLIVCGLLFQSVLPRVDALWLSRSIVSHIQQDPQLRNIPDNRIATVGYSEPSLVFMLGKGIKFLNVQDASAKLLDQQLDVVIVRNKDQQNFESLLPDDGSIVTQQDTVRGFNYSKGQWMDLYFYQHSERVGSE